MKIEYTTSVKTPAGWRPVKVVAVAKPISAGMAVVESVEEIDGETTHYGQSRTGAKRQQFNGNYFADAQIGTKKRLSACTII